MEGGSTKTVVDITGFFIDKGPIVQVKSTGGRKIFFMMRIPQLLGWFISHYSKSRFCNCLLEILAAALQDYERTVILGSKQTFSEGPFKI